MDFAALASGDNSESSPQSGPPLLQNDEKVTSSLVNEQNSTEAEKPEHGEKYENSPQCHDENNLKERIKQCRTIIESLKIELNQEKARLEKDTLATHNVQEIKPSPDLSCLDDIPYSTNLYNTGMEDENLIEYEKQLQRYQNTLNMAQIEKRNAIRKHMIAKAYKLKLLEVENQCNIELLRVKQSLQCLEPLQMIATKWTTSTDDVTYDLNNYELIPRYAELNTFSGSDVSSILDDPENKMKSPRSLNETIGSDT